MCLIFVRTKHSAPLNFDALESAHTDNPDGVGLMWYDNGWQQCREVDSTYGEIEQFIRKLDSRELRWAVHFRWATAGKVNKRNCHPFPIGDGAYLMHNGVLPYTPSRKERSDTWQFAQWVKGIGIKRFHEYSAMFEKASAGSRMLYALPNGALSYSGDWTHRPEGYYSNSRCLWKPTTQYYPTSSSYKGGERVVYSKHRSAVDSYADYYNRGDYDNNRELICTKTDLDDLTYEDVDTVTINEELEELILEGAADAIIEEARLRQRRMEMDEEA